MSNPLPELPRALTADRQTLSFWQQVIRRITRDGALLWAQVNKDGSKLSDLEERPHSQLTNILTVDPTSSDTARDKHLSNADEKANVDHRDATSDVHGGTGRIVGRGDHATLVQYGVVLQAASRADIGALTAATVVGTAGGTYGGGEEALINALVTAVNALIADRDTLKTEHNGALADERTAGQRA